MSGISAHTRHRPSLDCLAPHPGVTTHCLRTAAAAFGEAADSLEGPGRRAGRAAQARHLAAYLAHVSCQLPQRCVARDLACHVSSITYAVRRIEEARERAAFDRLVADLETQLRGDTMGRTQ